MISKEKRIIIRRKVEALRTLLELDDFPINLKKILDYEGIKLYFSDLDSLNIGDISGILNITKDSKSIHINRDHPKTRNLFTIGHELGHYFLHRDKLVNGQMISYRGKNYNVTEKESDLFSAELLMPKSKMLELAKEGKVTSKELAKIFGVSQTAMNYRIREINKELSEGNING